VAGVAPWRDGEALSYRLVDDDGKMLAEGVLRVEFEGGQTVLSQEFTSSEAQDTASVTVDSRTLKPVSARREIDRQGDGDDETIEVTYTDEGALIKQGDRQSGLSVPQHAYDNDSSLFLWRTLPFAEGYEASYVTIITNRRSRQEVYLRVIGKESVTVPAGTFDTWRLEITTSNARQTAWIADTPARPLVRYDNDRDVIFELTSRP
jgi:hypothetical protein